MKEGQLIICGLLIAFQCYCQSEARSSYAIGDRLNGGVIFWVDVSGQHGLIAAPSDVPGYTYWGGEGIVGATLTNEGHLNTNKIISCFSAEDKPVLRELYESDLGYTPAAFVCDNLVLGEYSDWYLPAINELKCMYDNQMIIGQFVAGYYWSSTEYNKKKAYLVDFHPGSKRVITRLNKVSIIGAIRCIRKF